MDSPFRSLLKDQSSFLLLNVMTSHCACHCIHLYDEKYLRFSNLDSVSVSLKTVLILEKPLSDDKRCSINVDSASFQHWQDTCCSQGLRIKRFIKISPNYESMVSNLRGSCEQTLNYRMHYPNEKLYSSLIAFKVHGIPNQNY